MKQFYSLTKTLLVAVCLLGGANFVWGETVQVLSENYESFSADADIKSALESVGWTFTGKDSYNPTAYCNQGTGTAVNTSKYANLYYYLGGASRQQYWNFASSVTSALTDDNWTLTFSAAMTPGYDQTGSGIAVSGTKSSFSATVQGITNPFFSMYNSAANGTTYTAVIGSTTLSGTYTLTSGTWYKFTISATNITNSTATIYVKVTSYDGETTVLESTQTDISTSSIGTLKGIVWGSARYNPRLLLDDVLLTKESDAEIANYTVKYVSTIADVETEIKSSVVREGEVGATVTLDGSDENTITHGGHQYYYVSDNASTSTINNDNSTVVKVVFAQATFDNGAYYFKNKANGAYFAGGNDWSTHAITNSIGHVVSLSVQSGGSYHLDTQISNGGASHYLNGVWTDGAAQGWTIASDGAGYYTISNGSGSNLTAGAVGEDLTVGASTDDDAKWTVMTAAEWKAENVARLDAATASNGVDATFYIPAANFNRNDNTENAKWNGSPTLGGVATNYNAEKHNINFDVYQTLTGLKPGAYKLTVQGFYRNGDAVDADATVCNAILYANSTEKALVNVVSEGKAEADADHGFTTLKSGKYVPDGQEDASKTFDNNYYNNELFFVVDDGALRVGVKKSTLVTNDWTVFDNFKLTYYGNSVFATIGSTGWTTFASPCALDLSNMTASTGSVTAYYASAIGSDKVTMTSTTSTGVAAGEGLMLKGTAGATITIPVAASGSAIDGNMLKGCTTSTALAVDATSGYNNYVLVNNGGTAEFQSLAENGATIPAGKAYLQNGTYSAGARLSIVFDDATAIKTVDAAAKSGAQADGKYLEKGKIVIVKNGTKFNANGQRMK